MALQAPGEAARPALPFGRAQAVPRRSDEFALTTYTLIAYLLPAFFVLLFGLDWTVFIVCVVYELILFLWARVVQMWLLPGGLPALVGTLFMIQPIGIATLAFLVTIAVLTSGRPVNFNGEPYEISVASRLLAGAAMLALTIDAVHRFRAVTLPRVRFKRDMNELYMPGENAGKRLFSRWQTVIENIILSFFGGTFAAMYFGAAMVITYATGALLQLFVTEERAFAFGAVVGFSAIRLALEYIRARIAALSAREGDPEQELVTTLPPEHGGRFVTRQGDGN